MESATIPARSPAAEPKPVVKPRRQGLLDEAGELALFSLRALRGLRGSPRYFSEVMRLNALITRRTTVLLLMMTFFAGVSVANFGFFFLRTIGASDFVGLIGGLFTTRLLGFQMFGYVFAGGVGCAIAAELGSATISEEVTAYEAQGIDPLEMLVGTRLLAVILYVPLATAVCMVGLLVGNFVTIVLVFQGNSAQTYLSTFFSVENVGDYLRMAVIVGVQAITCTIVACFYGLRARGGPAAVGTAVSRSLGLNLIVIHVLMTLMALLFWGGQLMVPIGD